MSARNLFTLVNPPLSNSGTNAITTTRMISHPKQMNELTLSGIIPNQSTTAKRKNVFTSPKEKKGKERKASAPQSMEFKSKICVQSMSIYKELLTLAVLTTAIIDCPDN